MPPELHFDLARVDFNHVLADREAIRQINPQRFDMEHLDAVVYMDAHHHIVIGYKDVRHDEFWVTGHMPGYPLLPGVLMCEAAAQLCSFYTTKQHVMLGDYIGFGGMDDVHFRNQVKPGNRLVLVGKGLKFQSRKIVFNVQGFVGSTMAFHADITGISLNRNREG
jgi:3-hydroxyacyl-[acyl-carrier-protein] dehydratase